MSLRQLNLYLVFVAGLLCHLFTPSAHAQDPYFSQYFSMPFYINPAMTGKEHVTRLHLTYRDQWPALEASYTTYAASADRWISSVSSGLGAYVIRDRAANGLVTVDQLSIPYAYAMGINDRLALRFGFEPSFQMRSVDWSRLTFGDMIDERYGFIHSSEQQMGGLRSTRVDFSSGVVLFTSQTHVGIAVRNMMAPGVVEDHWRHFKQRKYTVHAGHMITFDDRKGLHRTASALSLNAILEYQAGSLRTALGAYWKRGPVSLGVWAHRHWVMTALVSVELGSFALAYSYDLPSLTMQIPTGGAHEMGVQWRLPQKEQRGRRLRALLCPTF